MKQEITKEQWQEVNRNKQSYFWHIVDGGRVTDALMYLPPPNIGEMIAFLDETLFEIRRVASPFILEVVTTKLICFHNKELADSLWLACKQKFDEKFNV